MEKMKMMQKMAQMKEMPHHGMMNNAMMPHHGMMDNAMMQPSMENNAMHHGMMHGYDMSHYTMPMHHYGHTGYGYGAALLLVLFILLTIITRADKTV
jgi:uncharacterized protein (TIGR01732 family)